MYAYILSFYNLSLKKKRGKFKIQHKYDMMFSFLSTDKVLKNMSPVSSTSAAVTRVWWVGLLFPIATEHIIQFNHSVSMDTAYIILVFEHCVL